MATKDKKPTTQLYDDWVKRAEEQGISLSELCKRSDTDRSCIERWKHELPKSLKTYFAIEAQLKPTA